MKPSEDTSSAPLPTPNLVASGGLPQPERRPKPNRGDHLTIRTHAFAFEGKAIGRRDDGYVIFIEHALANETVEAEILKAKGSFAEAKIVSILEPSEERQTPICPHFGTCGGCALQHMKYEYQLFWKKQQVIDLFERIGKFPNPPVSDVLADLNGGFHYRNKMEFSFSDERWLEPEEIGMDSRHDRFALGMHVRNRFDRVIDLKACFLPNPVAMKILQATRQFARSTDLGVYHPDRLPDGLFRFLVVKTSHATGEIMVNLVTSRYDGSAMEKYTALLRDAVPSITTIVNNINGRRASVATGDQEYIIDGPGYIRDTIGSSTYRISANSFFQANTPQAERLYAAACEAAELKKDDILWDLYCGTGTISLFAADKVASVLGIELIEAAIIDARANAEANGISNVNFIASDLRHALTKPEFLEAYPNPNVMIIDPPRNGMHPDVVQEVIALAPERIAYISCNPATQARDIDMMREYYDLESLQPVDMFPQTFHIECVAKLRRKSS